MKEEAPQPAPQVASSSSSHNYAGFGKRFVAVFIDGIIIGIVNAVVALPFTAASNGEQTPMMTLAQLINVLIGVGYGMYFIGKKGQTPGKMAMKIKVVKKDGATGELGFMTAFLREVVGKFISSIPLGLGYLWVLWDKDKQTWHDKIAGTIVVKAE